MYHQLAEVSLGEGNRDLIYGVVDCIKSSNICKTNDVTKNVEMKTFDVRTKVDTVLKFLKDLIEEVLGEDDLIEHWESPGCFFVLFKIVSCKYCKQSLAIFNELRQHYSNNKNVRLGTIDCNRHRDLCHCYSIHRYPRFYWFENNQNGLVVSNFTGDRNTQELIKYVETKLDERSTS